MRNFQEARNTNTNTNTKEAGIQRAGNDARFYSDDQLRRQESNTFIQAAGYKHLNEAMQQQAENLKVQESIADTEFLTAFVNRETEQLRLEVQLLKNDQEGHKRKKAASEKPSEQPPVQEAEKYNFFHGIPTPENTAGTETPNYNSMNYNHDYNANQSGSTQGGQYSQQSTYF